MFPKKLINDFPSHGFVIDRTEARTLFVKVEKPNDALYKIGQYLQSLYPEDPIIMFLSKIKPADSNNIKEVGGDAKHKKAEQYKVV